ncbi:MAG: iron-containing alcohol dehydrogenase [Chloroflexi bacterium]|nr:iron-containing alcohol dehydrogenase [Chloroflexota bacterium]
MAAGGEAAMEGEAHRADPWRYDYTPPPTGRTVAGAGRLDEVGDLLEALGRRRALVVTSPSLVAQGALLSRLVASLGPRLGGVFAGTQRHSPIEVVRAALAQARAARADSVVSLGGGSSVDTAKGVVWYAETEAPELSPQPLTHLAIPSTLSGAEYTPDAGITIGAAKKIHAHAKIVPAVVVLDPDVAAATPRDLFLASGLNALAHCLEGTVSITRSPMADAYYLHAIRLLSEALPAIAEGDVAARRLAQAAAALAGSPSREMGLAHALVHVVGGRFRTPHAATHAIIGPAVMRFNQPAVADQQRLIAQALGREVRGLGRDAAAFEAARGVVALRQRLKLPSSLRDLGVPRAELRAAAEEAPYDRYYPTNPAPIPGLEAVEQVLAWAWSGEVPDVTV